MLVVYYSQTGQLGEIIDVLCENQSDIDVDYVQIHCEQYPFPLTWKSMFEMFPESGRFSFTAALLTAVKN